MKKINILITGSGGGSHGSQIAKALRLSSLEFELFYADMTSISVANKNSNFSLLPPASNKDYIEKLLKLCERLKINILFHGSEPELKVISENREMFEEKGVFLPINSKKVIQICMDKFQTNEFLKFNGFNFPISFEVTKETVLKNFIDFPYVLKPSIGAGGSQFTFIAQDLEELSQFSSLILEKFDKYILQEYVGNSNQEFTIGVLSDESGRILKSVSLKRIINEGLGCKLKVKNKTQKTELGEYLVISSGISQGYLSCDELVCSQAEEIATKLKSTGPLNIQCRLVGQKLYVFEINPRFSGTSSMRAMAGLNEPEILIGKKLNLPFKLNKSLKEGYYLRSLEEHFIPVP